MSLHILVGCVLIYLVISSNSAALDTDLQSNTITDTRLGKLGSLSPSWTQLAKDVLTKQTSNSQVLSLNLTNLVILLVLKAIIFGASIFGYGGGHHLRSSNSGTTLPDNARSVDTGDTFMSKHEMVLLLSYIASDPKKNYDCLYLTACEDPEKAKEYLVGGKLLLQGVKLLNNMESPDEKYDLVLEGLQEAVKENKENCARRYSCDLS